MSIAIDQLADTVQKELGVYSEKVTEATKKVIDSVTKETVAELQRASPRRTGKYAKDWTAANSYENTRTKRSTIHNRKHYQLTHLLENGHANRGGGRTAPNVHIAPIEQKAIQKLEDGIKGVAESAD